MTLVLPSALAAKGTSIAHSRGALAFGSVLLGVTFAGAAVLQVSAPHLTIWPGLIAIAVLGAGGALIATMHSDERPLIVAAVVIEIVGMVFLASVVIGFTSVATTTDMLMLSFAKVAIVLFGAAAGRWVPGIPAIIGAYVVAEGTVVAFTALTGGTIRMDWPPLIMSAGLVVGIAVLGVSRTQARAAEPALTRARIAEATAAGVELEKAASSALLHDTVLNELSVIALIPVGELAPSVREQIVRSIRRLGESAAPGGTITVERGQIVDAVAAARDAGLTVLVTGDPAQEHRLSPANASALGLALRQCLANVQAHSGVMEAEISVLSSGQSITVLVIDAGVGFVEDDIAPDRRGLRGSVRERIEAAGGSVQVWTTPGTGTSILLTVPVA